MTRNHELANRLAANEMLLDDPLEDRRIAGGVPQPFRIDHGNGSAFADTQAVRFGAEDAALLRQAELLQPALEELPRREAAILVAALRVGLIAAEENVTLCDRDADAHRDGVLRILTHAVAVPVRGFLSSLLPPGIEI